MTDSRVLILSVPSALVLAALVLHSRRSLPRSRAILFWATATLYGVLRGVGVRVVTEGVLGASIPYVIHDPILQVLGVSLQEVVGWTIVSYLGWWLGHRLGGDRLFAVVLWACLFLGAISWAVESGAQAAGWWHWTLPVTTRWLVNVPFIGLIDWFFVGTDFLLPFLLLTSGPARRLPLWIASLLVFPLHFASHAFPGRVPGPLPIPVFHLFHWILLGGLLWLAIRSDVRDSGFQRESGAGRAIPLFGIGLILGVVAFVEVVLAGRPGLLPSLLPAAMLALLSMAPAWALGASAAAVPLALLSPPLLLAAVPGAVSLVLRWASPDVPGRPLSHDRARGHDPARSQDRARSDDRAPSHDRARSHDRESLDRRIPGDGRRALPHPARRWRALAVVAALAASALALHAEGFRREREERRRLDAALAARNEGRIAESVTLLEALRRDDPDSYAARAFLGEIYYRTDRLEDARGAYVSAVAIKDDFLAGHRHLAVIALRQGDPGAALQLARKGLRIAPEDLELRYLAAKAAARGSGGGAAPAGLDAPDGASGSTQEIWTRAAQAGPLSLESMISLAYEIGASDEAADAIERALGRWPAHRPFYAMGVRIALGRGSDAEARRLASAWRGRFPGDREAEDVARRLGLP